MVYFYNANKINMDDINNMNLHEEIIINSFKIVKVPNGWIYYKWLFTSSNDVQDYTDGVFVPDLMNLC